MIDKYVVVPEDKASNNIVFVCKIVKNAAASNLVLIYLKSNNASWGPLEKYFWQVYWLHASSSEEEFENVFANQQSWTLNNVKKTQQFG